MSCFVDSASAGMTTVKPVPGTEITPPNGPTYADALTEVASGVVRFRLVTVVGSVMMPLSSSSGDDGAAVGAGATGPSLVEQLATSAAASTGMRKRTRMMRTGRGWR